MRTATTSAAKINTLAARWTAKHPELKARMERAKGLVAQVTPGRFPHVYFVASATEEGVSYIVRVNRKARTSTCTCPDHGQRGGRCKHILASALFEVGQA